MAKTILVTPIGSAVYPKITKPDTKGEYADNKFKVNLALDDADMAAFRKQFDVAIADMTFKVKKPAMPFKTITFKDGSTTEVLVAKSQYKPAVFDSQKKKVAEDVDIGGGSRLRLALEPYNYDKGVSLRLQKVQVIELQSYGGADEFDTVDDGFTADDGDFDSRKADLDI